MCVCVRLRTCACTLVSGWLEAESEGQCETGEAEGLCLPQRVWKDEPSCGVEEKWWVGVTAGGEGGEGVSAVFFQRRGAGSARPWLPGAPPICILMPAWVLFFRLCWVSAEVCGLL